jgi:hypothetical protein
MLPLSSPPLSKMPSGRNIGYFQGSFGLFPVFQDHDHVLTLVQYLDYLTQFYNYLWQKGKFSTGYSNKVKIFFLTYMI